MILYFISFACQVLEYQPEPMNNWNVVGQLEATREHHGVLSIDPELLPCLKGCLSKLAKVYRISEHLKYQNK